MPLIYLLVLVFLAKIVLIDSPVGKALGDAIRALAPPRTPAGSVSQGELEGLRREVEDLRDRLERVVEEQSFLTRLLSEPRRLSPGSGAIEDRETRT